MVACRSKKCPMKSLTLVVVILAVAVSNFSWAQDGFWGEDGTETHPSGWPGFPGEHVDNGERPHGGKGGNALENGWIYHYFDPGNGGAGGSGADVIDDPGFEGPGNGGAGGNGWQGALSTSGRGGDGGDSHWSCLNENENRKGGKGGAGGKGWKKGGRGGDGGVGAMDMWGEFFSPAGAGGAGGKGGDVWHRGVSEGGGEGGTGGQGGHGTKGGGIGGNGGPGGAGGDSEPAVGGNGGLGGNGGNGSCPSIDDDGGNGGRGGTGGKGGPSNYKPGNGGNGGNGGDGYPERGEGGFAGEAGEPFEGGTAQIAAEPGEAGEPGIVLTCSPAGGGGTQLFLQPPILAGAVVVCLTLATAGVQRQRRNRCATLIPLIMIQFASTPSALADAPIGAMDFERYSRWLQLSEDESILARAIFEDYSAKAQIELRPIYIEEYHPALEAYMAAVAAKDANSSPVMRELVPKIRAAEAKLRAEFDHRDAEFFADIESILVEGRSGAMQRVRLARRRARLLPLPQVPEENVDMVALLDGLGLLDSPSDAVVQFIEAHEERFFTALQRIVDARQRAQDYDIDAWQDAFRMRQNGAQPAEERMDSRETAGRMKIQPIRDLINLNRSAMVELGQILPDDEYSKLGIAYQRFAYDEIYPDPGDARALYEVALVIVGVTQSQQQSLAGLRAIFEQRHDQLSAHMAEAELLRRLTSIENEHDVGLKLNDLWTELRELGVERENLNRAQLSIIKSILTVEQAQHLPAWDFDAHPRPRPWDPRFDPDAQPDDQR